MLADAVFEKIAAGAARDTCGDQPLTRWHLLRCLPSVGRRQRTVNGQSNGQGSGVDSDSQAFRVRRSPTARRKRPRARERLDITVPIGTPIASAISL